MKPMYNSVRGSDLFINQELLNSEDDDDDDDMSGILS